jgi:hypothetical protein
MQARPTRRRLAVVLAVSVLGLAAALVGTRGAPSVAAQPGFQQHATGLADGATQAVATLRPTVAGATIVVCVGSDVAPSSIGDDKGNPYRLAAEIANSSGAGTLRIYYAAAARGGVTNVRVDHAWGHSDVVAAEYGPTRGLSRTAAADGGFNAGSAFSSGAARVDRVGSSLAVGCAFEVYAAQAPVTFAAGGQFTPRATQRGMFLQDRILQGPTRLAATGSRSPSANLNVVSAIAIFPIRGVVPPRPLPPIASRPLPVPTSAAPTTAPTTTTASTTPPSSSLPPLPGPTGPNVLFTDVLSGPTSGGLNGLGAPITIYGTNFGASRGSSTVRIGGVEVAAYLGWGNGIAQNPDLQAIVVQPGPNVTGGPIVVTVGSQSSPATVSFTANTAKVWYIAPSGSDTATCEAAAPCKSILHVAGSRMAPGDVLLVRGGVYDESEIWIREQLGHSGTAAQRKVITNYPGERPVFDNAARPFVVDANYVTVAGLTFLNGKSLGIPDVGLPGRRGVRFVNNSFEGVISWSAIDTHGDDHLVAGNVCRVSGSSVGTQGHCYYISYGNGVQLRYNVGSGAPGYGIHVFDQQRSTTDFRRTITNVLIEGNTLTSSTLRSGLILAMNDEGGRGNVIDGVVVRGNRILGNNHLGILVTGLVRNVDISANVITENGRQAVHIADDGGVQRVAITENTLVQSANSVCRQDCTWYPIAHIAVGGRAVAVTVSGNEYRPAPPVVIGAVDPAPR